MPAEFPSTTALAQHAADTTDVHGLADTAAVVLDDDARLTDARTPTAHTHTASEVTSGTFDRARLPTVAGLLHNLTATTPPTSAASAANGYGPGSVWIDTSADVSYECIDTPDLSSFPVTGVIDDFNRSDTGPPPGTLWGPSQVGGSTTERFRVRSNQVGPSARYAGGFLRARYGGPVEVYATVAAGWDTTADLALQLVAGGIGTTNYYGYEVYLYADGNGYSMSRIDVGGNVDIGSGTLALTAGDSVGFRRVGDVCQLWHKPSAGSWVLVATSAPDSAYEGPWYFGFYMDGKADLSQRLDNIGGGSCATWRVTSAPADVQTFNSSGTWAPPAWAAFSPNATTRALLVSGGGGGGSGARRASGTACSGGAGGGGGSINDQTFRTSELLPGAVTVGAGGTGGAAVTTNDTNGNAGSNGGATSLATVITGSTFSARAGGGGAGGQAGAAATAGAAGQSMFRGEAGGAGQNGAAGQSGNYSATSYGAGGGGAGGGISSGGSATAGGAASFRSVSTTGSNGGSVPGGAGVDGYLAAAAFNLPFGAVSGSGAGGGASSVTGAGGPGGAGEAHGGGGGGGGSSLNGSASGRGGDGAAGYAVLVTKAW